jgi:hypothetical protein
MTVVNRNNPICIAWPKTGKPYRRERLCAVALLVITCYVWLISDKKIFSCTLTKRPTLMTILIVLILPLVFICFYNLKTFTQIMSGYSQMKGIKLYYSEK